jgi:hypothetical protein
MTILRYVIYIIVYHGGIEMAGKRILITLSQEDKIWLESYSKAARISVAEALRQGIAILRQREGRETYRRLIEKTRGTWERGDGLDYQQAIRSEWEKLDS